MKKTSYYLMAGGLVLLLVTLLTGGPLNAINPVDSHPWTININGIRSFPWPEFTGGLLIALGFIFNIATWHQKKSRIA
ncbi:hypothetical protein D3C87_403960 [compost metagenome]|uniref:hypothetical protein n=1 Tax=Pedobacter ghigonis TaxID=2730403 RepID=UPI000FB802FD|nr:hypothetical protein [Pedobacter ghigonis]